MAADTDKQSFWEHLDVLRAAIVKSLLVAVVFGVAAFCFKEELFAVILAPKDADFITYRLLYSLGGLVTESGAPDFLVKLINTGLAGQFIIHMKAALCAGVLCASPYILYQLFRFVSPALYVNERKYVVQVVGGGYAMFALGVANKKGISSWGWYLAGGIIDLILGIFLMASPGLSMEVLPFVLAFWLMFRGFSATGYSMDLKRYGTRNWGWYMVFGILAILCSIGVIWQPALGAFTLVYMIAYALLIIGIFRVMLSFELKSLHKRNKEAQAE